METYNIDVYEQERTVWDITVANAAMCQVVCDYGVFSHYTEGGGRFLIDLTDLVRLHPTGTISVFFYNDYGRVIDSAQGVLSLTYNGLINPDNMQIPINRAAPAGIREDLQNGRIIMPPSVVYTQRKEISGLIYMYITPRIEIVTRGTPFDAYSVNHGVVSVLSVIGNTIDLPPYYDYVYIESSDFIGYQYYMRARPLEIGRSYAMVQWVSRFGTIKRCIWECLRGQTEQQDTYKLYSMYNAYNVHNGITDKLTLRLTGLDAYDYWYYADIITSSDVRVITLDSADSVTERNRVEVTTKSVTIPDGDAGATLTVNVNLQRYDAI